MEFLERKTRMCDRSVCSSDHFFDFFRPDLTPLSSSDESSKYVGYMLAGYVFDSSATTDSVWSSVATPRVVQNYSAVPSSTTSGSYMCTVSPAGWLLTVMHVSKGSFAVVSHPSSSDALSNNAWASGSIPKGVSFPGHVDSIVTFFVTS